MTDPADLYDDVLAAARTALSRTRARHGDDLRAMALYSDDDGITVCEAFDTHSHLAAHVARAPDDVRHWTYWPAEWAMEATSPAAELFHDLSRRAGEGHDAATGGSTDGDGDGDHDAHRAWREGLFETCVRVLEALRPDAGDLLLLFTVTDSGHRDEVAWMRRTSPDHAERFATYSEQGS